LSIAISVKVCYNIITVRGNNPPQRKEVFIIRKWLKKYKMCKAIGVKHPLAASFRKNYLGIKSL